MLLRSLCRHPKRWVVRNLFQVFFLSILSILILVALLAYLTSNYLSRDEQQNAAIIGIKPRQGRFGIHTVDSNESSNGGKSANPYQHVKLISLNYAATRQVQSLSIEKDRRISVKDERRLVSELKGGWSKCSMANCFDIHRCGRNGRQKLSIYVYPIEKFVVDGKPLYAEGRKLSREFYEFIDAIRQSPFYVSNPNEACIFVPSIDLIALVPKISSKDLNAALSSLEFWGDNGQNHVLFSMFPGNSSLLSLGTEAVIASSGFPIESYRLGFHVPLLSFNPLLREYIVSSNNMTVSHSNFRDQNIIAISTQGHLHPHLIEDDSILVLDICTHKKTINYLDRCKGSRVYKYPEVLNTVDFCIIVKDLSGPTLWDIMRVGCIPVIIADFQRLPFDEVIDWKRHAVVLYEHQIPQLSSILQAVSQKRRTALKSQGQIIFNKYFKSMYQITSTLLQVLHDRVFSHSARTLEEWNHNPEKQNEPLFNPVIAPKDTGFTAVILAYERIPSLFQVIERVSMVPSLVKIIVVWNNQAKQPPPYSSWPKTNKPVKVIQMDKNVMSNRFYPFDEIETEAVFSLDDDIIMLTVDEIEFGFEAWREYPDRIVGFPSRSHVWDNSSRRWKYDSEWTNEISMVLTGASFYHKYWHHAYTHQMSSEIREWVDAKMNCEDIAMNFLVAANTKKAPIKVTPRKKFKCPTCSNNEMLSSDSSHMVERTDCINKFVQIYGYMPLVLAEYRVDPVLYKVDGLPKRYKKFSEVGSL